MVEGWASVCCCFVFFLCFHVTLSLLPKKKASEFWAHAIAPQTPLCLGVALECRKHAAVIEVNDCAPPLKRGGTAAEIKVPPALWQTRFPSASRLESSPIWRLRTGVSTEQEILIKCDHMLQVILIRRVSHARLVLAMQYPS